MSATSAQRAAGMASWACATEIGTESAGSRAPWAAMSSATRALSCKIRAPKCALRPCSSFRLCCKESQQAKAAIMRTTDTTIDSIAGGKELAPAPLRCGSSGGRSSVSLGLGAVVFVAVEFIMLGAGGCVLLETRPFIPRCGVDPAAAVPAESPNLSKKLLLCLRWKSCTNPTLGLHGIVSTSYNTRVLGTIGSSGYVQSSIKTDRTDKRANPSKISVSWADSFKWQSTNPSDHFFNQ